MKNVTVIFHGIRVFIADGWNKNESYTFNAPGHYVHHGHIQQPNLHYKQTLLTPHGTLINPAC